MVTTNSLAKEHDGGQGDDDVVLTPEEVIEKLGGCGRYQIILSTIVHSMKLVVCFTMINLVFSAKSPDWWCVQDLDMSANDWSNSSSSHDRHSFNLSSRYKKCELENGTRCTSFLFDDELKTLVSEWSLVCDDSWIPSTMASVQMFGVLVGNAVCGQLADTIGRKKPLFVSLVIIFIFNLVSMFSVSWTMFIVCRFILGIGNGAFVTVQYSIMTEFTLSKWRPVVVAFPSFQLESCLFALAAWLLRDWKYLHLLTALFCVPFLATWWFIPESFRWFVAHDRHDDVKSVVKFIGKINKQPVPDFKEMQTFSGPETARNEVKKEQKSHTYTAMDLFKSRKLLRVSVLLVTNWFALGLIYYGVTFGIKNLSGSLYLNLFLFNFIGIPFKFVIMYLQNRIGRRYASIILFAFTAVFYFVAGILQYTEFPARDKVIVAFVIMGVTSISVAWSPVQTITLELYPTVVRNIAYGFLNTMARIGAIVGPQIVFLDNLVPGILYFICGGVSLMVVVCTLLLPETNGVALHDKIQITIDKEDEEGKEYH